MSHSFEGDHSLTHHVTVAQQRLSQVASHLTSSKTGRDKILEKSSDDV